MDAIKVVGSIRMTLAYMKWGWELLFHLSFFHHRHRHHSYNYELNHQQPDHDQVQEYYEPNDVVSATAEDLRQSSECAVCLSKVEQGEEIRKLTCCHVFHKVCLDRWSTHSFTRRHPTCPLCRRPLSSTPTTSRGSAGGPEVVLFDFASFVSSDHALQGNRHIAAL
ncbi:unnamed protein product [Linum tenue]|uniref:RING-type domain-containing protein n=1 Tax=Linum tenue TaxID=586396 RepID=A0AAV0NC00_9ROSI|nr:unnamed protein product [Linum tenue]